MTRPWHAVQLTDSQFVVSHHGPVHGVSLIDKREQVKATYRNSESTELVNRPRQLAVTKNGSILVVDSCNNRIVALNSSLSSARDLSLPIEGGLKGPRCLYFNESYCRLYVGDKRVLIFDNINLRFT